LISQNFQAHPHPGIYRSQTNILAVKGNDSLNM